MGINHQDSTTTNTTTTPSAPTPGRAGTGQGKKLRWMVYGTMADEAGDMSLGLR